MRAPTTTEGVPVPVVPFSPHAPQALPCPLIPPAAELPLRASAESFRCVRVTRGELSSAPLADQRVPHIGRLSSCHCPSGKALLLPLRAYGFLAEHLRSPLKKYTDAFILMCANSQKDPTLRSRTLMAYVHLFSFKLQAFISHHEYFILGMRGKKNKNEQKTNATEDAASEA